MDLNNIVGFKAVDKNGNERQVTVDEMTELVSARIVSAASEISTFAAAAAAGTDEFEDQLPQSDTFSWLRTLDGSKNPTLTSSSAAAKVLGELIGTATANKNGLMSKIFAVTDIERGKGLIIDYKADSNGLYTSSSLIEIYVYSGANTAFYRVMSIPTGSKNIEIKYMGTHWCDFKYANSKLYVLPKSDDSSISYKVSLVRRTRPNFLTIDFSDFSNITGEIITPTPD
ncbi:hypothetical protein AAH085_07010 [Phocaeicola vulgatus]|jgi:hypothetical protein|uniref:hypothetical protein n=3 Tax=Phocaeicola vulgatus TaxID=821 RepID=UPI00202FFBA5|nr:hypothetical protein [Phocaeicola vulgatus]MCM1741879.1 hypothetical protein [Phocaeicola vulgatus]MCM1751223.1 hypothetical protein [Phocaeicola vulgatus]